MLLAGNEPFCTVVIVSLASVPCSIVFGAEITIRLVSIPGRLNIRSSGIIKSSTTNRYPENQNGYSILNSSEQLSVNMKAIRRDIIVTNL